MNDDFQMNETILETAVSQSFEAQAQENTAQAAIDTVAHDAIDSHSPSGEQTAQEPRANPASRCPG